MAETIIMSSLHISNVEPGPRTSLRVRHTHITTCSPMLPSSDVSTNSATTETFVRCLKAARTRPELVLARTFHTSQETQVHHCWEIPKAAHVMGAKHCGALTETVIQRQHGHIGEETAVFELMKEEEEGNKKLSTVSELSSCRR